VVSRNVASTLALVLRTAFVGVWVLFTVWILLWLVLSSLKGSRQIFAGMWGLPTEVHLENYESAWLSTDLATAMRNSIVVDAISTAAILALAAPAAYALSRVDFRGAGTVLNFFVVGIGIPLQVLLIPLYVMMARLGLVNSLVGLSIEYIAVSLPFTVFLLTGFFRTLPSELEEAAMLDGASPLATFVRIMLPLAAPGLITAAIINVVGIWNEFFLALVLLNENSKYTLPVAIVNMYGSLKFTGNWGGLLAGIVIVILPITTVYVLLSNRIIRGLTFGSGR
jgi:N-acetylglucosamine transport system permease protein